jgi:hypothetical protein
VHGTRRDVRRRVAQAVAARRADQQLLPHDRGPYHRVDKGRGRPEEAAGGLRLLRKARHVREAHEARDALRARQAAEHRVRHDDARAAPAAGPAFDEWHDKNSSPAAPSTLPSASSVSPNVTL